jgi:hypothetical protein
MGNGAGCTWDDDLGQGHVVVGHKDKLEQVADVGVGVDLVAHRADQLDDALGHLIAWSSLASHHANPRNHLQLPPARPSRGCTGKRWSEVLLWHTAALCACQQVSAF